MKWISHTFLFVSFVTISLFIRQYFHNLLLSLSMYFFIVLLLFFFSWLRSPCFLFLSMTSLISELLLLLDFDLDDFLASSTASSMELGSFLLHWAWFACYWTDFLFICTWFTCTTQTTWLSFHHIFPS